MSSGKVPAAQIKRFEQLYRLPDNRECFDCTSKQPRWGSTNLGIFFCLRCAGIHRSLGVHISKVKSSTMDTWDEEMIQRCERIGNGNGKMLYEAKLPSSFRKPDGSCDASEIERVIRQKYDNKLWYAPNFEDLLAQLLATPPPTTPGPAAVSPVTPPAVSQLPSQQQQQASSANWTAFVSSPTTVAAPPQQQAKAPQQQAKAPQQQPSNAAQAPDFWSAFEGSSAAAKPPPSKSLGCDDLFGPTASTTTGNHRPPPPSVFTTVSSTSKPASEHPVSLFGEFKSSPTVPASPASSSDHLMDFGSTKPKVETHEIMALFSNNNTSTSSTGAHGSSHHRGHGTSMPPVRY